MFNTFLTSGLNIKTSEWMEFSDQLVFTSEYELANKENTFQPQSQMQCDVCVPFVFCKINLRICRAVAVFEMR